MIWIVIVILLSGTIGELSPDPDRPLLTLDEAISIALEENHGIEVRRLEAEIASSNRTLGNAGFLPSLQVSGSLLERVEDSRFRLSNDPDVQENLGARSRQTGAGVSLNWTLFDGTGMFIRHEQLGEMAEAGEAVLRLEIEETVHEIVRSYAELVTIASQIEMLAESVGITEQRIEIAESQVEVGTASEYDLLEARTDLNADRASLVRERHRFDEARIRFNERLGREQDLTFRVSEEIDVNRSLVYEELRARGMEENTELMLARVEQRIADLEVRELRSRRLPEIELQGGYDYNRTDGGGGFLQFNETQGFHIGLTARLNLFDGFDESRRIQNARIQQRSRQVESQQVMHRLEADLLSAWRSYRNSLELVELEESNLEYAGERLDIAVERLAEGVISALEFRESQRAFLDANDRYFQALYEAKVAESDLLRLSGDMGDLAL